MQIFVLAVTTNRILPTFPLASTKLYFISNATKVSGKDNKKSTKRVIFQ